MSHTTSSEIPGYRNSSLFANKGNLAAVALLLVPVTALFWREVLFPMGRVLGGPETDIAIQFIAWRRFGFDQLRAGNLALWNPHVFGGAPFLGNFQSALLYPFNVVHLFFSLDRAINLEVLFHVWLAGALTYSWARLRGCGIHAALLAGLVFMFSGPFFTHVYAGHLPHIAVMAWAPAVMLTLDWWVLRGSTKALYAGALAVAMQIYAGHPQYLYYTAIAASMYAALHIALVRENWKAMLFGLIAMYAGGLAIGAVQFLAGLEAAMECVRSGGTSLSFAGMFSLPPESIATLCLPALFGDIKHVPYFGRCYLWEVSLYVGVTGLLLAVVGAFGPKDARRRLLIPSALIIFVLALGIHTPFFRLLYYCLPGYSFFRGTAKFSFLFCLFVALLAGTGLQDLLDRGARRRWLYATALLGLVLLVVGIALLLSSRQGGDGTWARILSALSRSAERPAVESPRYSDPRFIRTSGVFAAFQCFIASGITVLLVVLLRVARRGPRLACLLLALSAVELSAWAYNIKTSVPVDFPYPSEYRRFADKWMEVLKVARGRERVLVAVPGLSNLPMLYRADDLWGNDPFVVKRYAEFIAVTQGRARESASQYAVFKKAPPVYRMLRCRYILQASGDALVKELASPFPRAFLVTHYRLMKDADRILDLLAGRGAGVGGAEFDLRREIILEAKPTPEPKEGGFPGRVQVLAVSTDFLDIAVEIDHPAILVITDTYSSGWRAVPVGTNPQQNYKVMPANYCLRAVPLAAGRHRIRLEYRPRGFVVGAWITLVSLLGLLPASIYLACKTRRRGLLPWSIHEKQRAENG